MQNARYVEAFQKNLEPPLLGQGLLDFFWGGCGGNEVPVNLLNMSARLHDVTSRKTLISILIDKIDSYLPCPVECNVSETETGHN
jgi:hypothetical protein